MAQLFEMPQASPTMERGTILTWLKAEGDALAPQDAIAEVETDKAAMEIEVFDKGYLLKILAPVGAEVPAGQPIAILGTQPDEDISALLAQLQAAAPLPQAVAPAPAAPPAAPPTPRTAEATSAGLQAPTWMGRPIHPAIMEFPGPFAPSSPRPRVAPAARAAARALGVELASVQGTGPRGRVLREDVERTAHGTPAAAPQTGPEATVIRNTQMRKTIARRLTQVWHEAPVFTLTANLHCDALVTFRAQLRSAGVRVSANDILIKACALALREVPAVNASWGDEAITRHAAIHVGVAVALDDGLITPVLRDADTKGLRAISHEIRELADRARRQKLEPAEYTGSTFTISNLGMMGIESFSAILNPPEAVILAVGALQREPVVDQDGALGVGWRMRVTLTCDHRVVDGALGASFLQALRNIVEHPAALSA